MTSREIRRQFIDFFVQKHGHTFVPSNPVVPRDDPTLLFTNAGMNQFKPFFLGMAQPAWTRAVNTQKCIRAGGKHNDLDDVGLSPRHHTFFEMLGNWSFGDYFKAGAIEMAWELLTEVWKLDPRRLHVTVYEGDPAGGVPADEEAVRLWRRIAQLPQNHIHRFGADNFWEMGDTGPCGPCTEIFIDRTPDFSGGQRINGDDPRVMEIWNLVFIQYNRDADRKLAPLPAEHVDTGMGLERLCQVLQGCGDNYATDLFTPLFAAIGDLCGRRYGGMFPAPGAAASAASHNPDLLRDIAFRVIADHVRCLSFALVDGAAPSNEGRGYVLRRILRRAVRFGRQTLNMREPFLHRLAPVIADMMGDAFPELKNDTPRVAEVIRAEEEGFIRTLDRGLELFDAAARAARTSSAARPVISATDAFQLHDTYGFPIDLTQIMARERDLDVDVAGYEELMSQAREKARGAGKSLPAEPGELPPHVLAELAARRVGATNDQAKYAAKPLRTMVAAMGDGSRLQNSAAGDATDQLALILEKTNFYAEMGGQVGDQGEIRSDQGAVFTVQDTRRVEGFVLHIGRIVSGRFQVGDMVTAEVSPIRRQTEMNHTGTHLLNWALRETLGTHVEQKGSLVDPDKLRFDFVHPRALEEAQLSHVEELVTAAIRRNMVVYTAPAALPEAVRINSLRAIFGEKYPPVVRVVSIGAPVEELLKDPANPRWREYSIEFCGGTHLAATGQVGEFTITAEESVSRGVRRIVALTGRAAAHAGAQAQGVRDLIERGSATRPQELPALIAALEKASRAPNLPVLIRRCAQQALAEFQESLKPWLKQQREVRGPLANGQIEQLIAAAQVIGHARLVVGRIADGGADTLRTAMDMLRKKLAPAPVAMLLAATQVEMDKDGNPLPPKVNLLAAVSDGLVDKIKAGDWIKQVAPLVGGSGGGRPQMAMAGGKDVDHIEQALAAGRELARNKLQA